MLLSQLLLSIVQLTKYIKYTINNELKHVRDLVIVNNAL